MIDKVLKYTSPGWLIALIITSVLTSIVALVITIKNKEND